MRGNEGLQNVQIQGAPGDGSQLEQGAVFTRHPLQPPLDDLLHAPGKDGLGQFHPSHSSQSSGFLRQGAHGLHQEEGVALGLALQKIEHLRLRSCFAQHGGAQGGGVGRVKAG